MTSIIEGTVGYLASGEEAIVTDIVHKGDPENTLYIVRTIHEFETISHDGIGNEVHDTAEGYGPPQVAQRFYLSPPTKHIDDTIKLKQLDLDDLNKTYDAKLSDVRKLRQEEAKLKRSIMDLEKGIIDWSRLKTCENVTVFIKDWVMMSSTRWP